MPRPSTPGRRRLQQFLLAVAAVHGVAIAAYHLFDIPSAPLRAQRVFAWVWMGATVVVVVVGLQAIKRARRRGATIRRLD